jgi:hypothetical protein
MSTHLINMSLEKLAHLNTIVNIIKRPIDTLDTLQRD